MAEKSKKKQLISEEVRERALYRETSYRYTTETEKRHELLFSPYDVSFPVFRVISYLLMNPGSATPAQIAEDDFSFLETIGLRENLSPTRAGGLSSMVATIRQAARDNC